MQMTQRKRSQNWINEDKILLQELVRERVSVVENKNTDTNTNKMKKEAWAYILESFNSVCKGNMRTVCQLKTQWGLLKMSAKKEKAAFRKEVHKTGGGPQPLAPDDNFDDISSWLPNEFIIDTNEFDSDGTVQVTELIEICHNEQSQEQVLTTDAFDVNTVHLPEEKNQQCTMETVNVAKITEQLEPITGKPRQKRKKISKSSSDVAKKSINLIMQLELKQKRELHKLHIINERKKSRNLDMEFRVLKEKLKLAKNKSLGSNSSEETLI